MSDMIQCPKCKKFNTCRIPDDEQFYNNNLFMCININCWCVFDPTGKLSTQFINCLLQTYEQI